MKAIYLEGFKSFFNEQRISLADITIFAGANSSGKSSAMQPLLLMKQTIESQYDPGVLLMAGANIKFTSLDQMLSKRAGSAQKKGFTVSLELDSGNVVAATYSRSAGPGVGVKASLKTPQGLEVAFGEGRKFNEQESSSLTNLSPNAQRIIKQFSQGGNIKLGWEVVQARCFPDLKLVGRVAAPGMPSENFIEFEKLELQRNIRNEISDLIHIQGLRGNPERTYSSTAKVAKNFPGVFTDYVASVLQRWQEGSDHRLEELGSDLRRLGLSWKIKTNPVHDTQVEIRVSRLPIASQGGAHDLVNLADVGLGVSQVLPFLVALRAAKSGQVVFVEQPEIHLHPRAQYELAEIILEAVNRGVRVWLETHSSSILRAFQTQVAHGALESDRLALNWFARDSSTGSTSVSTAKVGPLGQYGEWPADFDDVSLYVEKQFLDAVSMKAFSGL